MQEICLYSMEIIIHMSFFFYVQTYDDALRGQDLNVQASF